MASMFVEREYDRLRRELIPGLCRLGGADVAEDVADEALMRAWVHERSGHTVNGGFVWRVALNLWLSHRRHAAFLAPGGTKDTPVPFPEPLPPPDLSPLKPALRDAVVLSAAGHNQSEIGLLLGVGRTGVNKRLKKARALLRDAG